MVTPTNPGLRPLNLMVTPTNPGLRPLNLMVTGCYYIGCYLYVAMLQRSML